MKAYHLKSVEFEGRRYSDCSLVIDDQVGRVELLRSSGRFRGSQVPFMSLPLGSETQVEVQGARVKLGTISMIAESSAVAVEISSGLRPTTPTARPTEVLAGLRDSVFDFLRARQEGIGFLLKLKSDPRQALVDIESSYSGKYDNPAMEYVEKFSKRLEEAYAKIDSAVSTLQSEDEISAAERVYTFVYGVGVYQNKLVQGATNLSEVLAFVQVLGVDIRVEATQGIQIDTETILEHAENLFGPGAY